jgi:hypothetical protein
MVPQSCRAQGVILAFDKVREIRRAILRHTCDRDWNQSARHLQGPRGLSKGKPELKTPAPNRPESPIG